MTAWRDRKALTDFVRGAAHTSVVTRTRHRMAGNAFASWTASGAALPPTWATVNSHLSAHLYHHAH